MTWHYIVMIAIAAFLIWTIFRHKKAAPEEYTKAAFSKSFGTMGILALALIAFIALLAILAKG